MKKTGRILAILVALVVLIYIFMHLYNRGSGYRGTDQAAGQNKISPILSDDQIMVPNPPPNITQPTKVDTIITKPDGTVVEKEYVYDPSTTTIQIDSGYDQDNASLFFPGLALGFLFAEGSWVDHDGYYWHNNNWVQINDNHWHDHWNNYWHNDWNNHHWNNHWQNNHNNHNWNNNHPQHWHNPGGISRGGHGGHAGGMRTGGGGHGGHR